MRAFVFAGLLLATLSLISVLGCSSGGNDNAQSRQVTVTTLDGGTLKPLSAQWAAYQDGMGIWKQLIPSATGQYSFTVTDAMGRYGMAFVNVSSQDNDVHLQITQGTVSEATSLVMPLNTDDSSPSNSVTLTGATSNFPQSSSPSVWVSGVQSLLPVSGSYTTGNYDVYGSQNDIVCTTAMSGTPRMSIERDAALSGIVTRNFDYSGDTFFNLSGPVTLNLAGVTGTSGSSLWYITKNGLHVRLSGSTTAFPVPTDKMVSGECQVSDLMGYFNGGNNFVEQFTTSTTQPTQISLTAPASFTGNTINMLITTPSLCPQMTFVNYTGAKVYGAYFEQYPTGGDITATCAITPGWLSANATTSYTVPDLSSVTGWQSGWGLKANKYTDCYAYTVQSTGSVSTANTAMQAYWWSGRYAMCNFPNTTSTVVEEDVSDQVSSSVQVKSGCRHHPARTEIQE